MSPEEQTELVKQLRHLAAENQSLKEQLEEYQFIVDTRDKQLTELKNRIASSTELQSNLDNQVEELQLLQDYIGDLKKQSDSVSGRVQPLNRGVGNAVSVEQQLADMKQEYAYQQTQLTDLQTQLQDLYNRNLLLQQQNSRMAELESMLADAELERDEWALKAREQEEKK